MRTLLLISLLLSLVVFSGCSTIFEDYYYSVSVDNIGTKGIWVENFKICKGNYSSIRMGALNPFTGGPYSSYIEKPYSSVWIQWRFMKDNKPYGKSYGKTVYINLPKEFDKKHGDSINFYINPDEEKVIVSYVVLTEFNEKKEINSDGSRFQLPKTPKKKLSQKE